jgi:fructokinase
LRAENGLSKQYAVNPQETVSTIGAGDNFNAGFLYGLLKNGVTHHDMQQGLSEELWDAIIESGKQFSAEVCKSLYNYVSPAFGKQKKQELEDALQAETEEK